MYLGQIVRPADRNIIRNGPPVYEVAARGHRSLTRQYRRRWKLVVRSQSG